MKYKTILKNIIDVYLGKGVVNITKNESKLAKRFHLDVDSLYYYSIAK
ncbi:MAG: hypothetical protein K1000chlam1_00614 [Candidatus Anoxychlamydiales bacterium]|nr:hypothetical protein [Candidatus Anoxychlamydiales bacterium]